MKRFRSKNYTGVYYKEHEIRKNGVKPDRYYTIRYTKNGKSKEEGLGWASNGMTELKAMQILGEIKTNIRLANGEPTSLSEKRELEIRKNSENMTFREWFLGGYTDTYLCLKSYKKRKQEIYDFNTYFDKFFGNIPLKKVTSNYLQKVKVAMKKKRLAEATIKKTLCVMSCVFNKAKETGVLVGENPCERMEKISINNNRVRFLTSDEANKLLNEIKISSKQLYEMSIFALHMGLRAGEIFNIVGEDVNMEMKQITIRNPKNKSDRFAYMTNEVYSILKTKSLRNGEYVFKSTKGTKINGVSSTYSRIVERLGFNNGIKDAKNKVVFHTLRHTYASWLVQSGVDLYRVQRLMGHKSIKMTERYAHLAPNNLSDSVNILNKINDADIFANIAETKLNDNVNTNIDDIVA